MADEFKYTVEGKFGVLSESNAGWKVELRLISWNERPAKYDIRSWAPNDEKMGKGITLTRNELAALKDLLNSMQI
ncbi:hypothetical protein DWQ65_00970 [Treponema phagedenis]|uniref:Transcriptional coactivator p15 (PC4) C-terminal domain-containing protein n=1 Tax=Treponema phagedenis TaxID=162 RepID=A0A0B7GTJ1_TREPH|nr:PC4/YdbC family ssDNA-binding protein [Treponema phagedenis]EFW38421.1 hypothetical protein HMPREF9554_01060 [Treponema phagedenis F0421]NVP25213.1 hypothetical protein [Treponema phagedenis]NVP25529.1 hypothetical protein [Treponema phagedenis]QEJ95927.1 hypothetical protein FUT79_12430 [Treponema phagedenis]QEJ97329.1 hypothetical protein FUT82_04540 [Treponema phagedenis]